MSVISGVVVNSVAVTANTALRGPTSGADAVPSFRADVVADLPTSGTWAFAGTISGNLTFSGTPVMNSTLTLGVNGSSAGQLIVRGSTSGAITIQGAAAAGTWTMTLPTSGGTNGYVLQTDGAGTTSWVAQTGGGGTTVTTPFWPYPSAVAASDGGGSRISSANNILLYPFIVPFSLKVTNMVINVFTADGTNNTDFGIYDTSGNLKCHAGAQTFASTGAQSIAMTGGAVTLAAGTYLWAYTSAATTFFWGGAILDASNSVWYYSTTTSSSGGALPSTVTVSTSASTSAPSQWLFARLPMFFTT